MVTPYEGLRVLDVTTGYGAIVGMVLADFGADVVKIERPGGGPFRAVPGSLQWDRGKRSAVLDLTSASGREHLAGLVRHADVLVHNQRPSRAERLGLTYEHLSQDHPRLVHATITGFEPGTPYADVKGYEGVVSARTGQMVIQNGYRDGPIYDAVFKNSFGASMLALIGVLAALRARDATGRGQALHTSLVRSNFIYSYGGVRAADPRVDAQLNQIHARDPHNYIVGYRIAECADGRWIQSGSAGGRTYENFMRALGIDEYFTRSRFRGRLSDQDRAELIAKVDAAYRTRTLEEWIRILDQHDAAYALFATTQEFMDHPQMRHNGHVVAVDDPRVGPMEQIGPLATFVGETWRWPGPAPQVGEHTDEILASCPPTEPSAPETPGQAAGSAGTRQALEGLTIVDLSTYAAAPGGPGLLADLGATVVKVEPAEGDPLGNGPLMGELFLHVNRGKRRLAVDLKTEAGQEVLHRLVANADVVVHNFRPGVPERLGADAPTLLDVNPRLVYVYAASFGSSGPDAHRPAFDPVISAMAGGEVLQAGRQNPPQMRQTTDHSALLTVAVSILLGVRARDRTGRGQQLETTMLNAAAYLFSDDFLRYDGKPERPLPDPGQYGLHALYRLYRTSDAGWVFLAAPTDAEWRTLCRVIDREEWLEDPRFRTSEERCRNDEELASALQDVLAMRPDHEWEAALLAEEVACVRADVNWTDFLFAAEHAGPGEYTASYDLPELGQVWQVGAGVELHDTPGSVSSPEPVGGSTQQILSEVGYDDEQIDHLASSGIVTVG